MLILSLFIVVCNMYKSKGSSRDWTTLYVGQPLNCEPMAWILGPFPSPGASESTSESLHPGTSAHSSERVPQQSKWAALVGRNEMEIGWPKCDASIWSQKRT